MRAQLLAEGEKLARQRQSAVYRLIAQDPAAALAATIHETSRRLLPDSIRSLLESPASAQGDLVVIVDDSARHRLNRREVYRQAQIQGQTFDAYVYGRRARQQTKYGTSLIGITLNDRMAVLEEPARLLSQDDLPQGAKLEASLIDDTHPAPAAQDAASTPILQVAGAYYPVPSPEYAQNIAAQWMKAEDQPGPILQALGTSLPGTQAAAPAQASSHQLGTQSVLVIVADFSDATGRPLDAIDPAHPSITSTLITQKVGVETADFYTQASYGKTTLGSPSITEVLRLSGTLASYSTSNNTAGLKNDALAAATAAGFTPANFDRVMVVIPNTHAIIGDQFTWSGLAELGGSFAWINGNISLGVLAHELGHNYGLSHAKLWQIPGGSTDPVDPAGSALDYGDPFDIMGGAIGDPSVQPDPPNPFYLNNLGWLPDSAVQTIGTNSAQPFRVYRFDHKDASASHPLALRINRSEGVDYWIGYRRKYQGYGSYGDMGDGAYVFWAKDGNPSTELIDIDTPGINPKDASLNTTQTFTDTAAGITMQVTQGGGTSPDEYLDVQVTYQSRIAFEHKINNVDEHSGTVSLTVQRLNSFDGSITAHYTTVPGTAHAGQNYTTTDGTLTWADGDSTPRTIQVPVLVDPATSGTTTFTVEFDTTTGCVFPGGKVATINVQKTGAADSLFVHPFLTSNVNALSLQPDGRLVIGGNFGNTSAPVTSSGISRLQSSGSLDTSFDQGPGIAPLAVTTLARQPDGKILVGGSFTSIRGMARNRIARLLPNGGLDLAFNAGTGPGNPTVSRNVIKVITVQPDGKILVGGQFTTWNGASRKTLVRLNEDGTLDTTFGKFESVVTFFAGSESVNAIALQPASAPAGFTIVVGGLFYRQIGMDSHGGIVRLNASGTRDTTFDAVGGAMSGVFVSQVSSLALQIDGKIVAGGQFTTFNGSPASHLVRLSSTGANDAPFVTGLGAGLTSAQALCDVVSLRVQADGGILAGGYFEKAANVAQGIARFKADGTRDTAFMPAIESWFFDGKYGNGVTSMELAPDNTLYIGLNNSGSNPQVVKRLFTGSSARAGIVQFASVGASVNKGTAATLSVERTGGSSGRISINYQTVGHNAIAGTHFTASTGTLVWNDGDTAPKSLSIPTKLTTTADGNLVFDVRLGIPMGGVSLGQRGVANVTILDPFSKPVLTTPPANIMAAVGALNATFHSEAAANPAPTYQWYKAKTKIIGAATQDFSLSNLQLTQAGQYSVIATNSFGTATGTAELGVVNSVSRTVNVTAKGTATLTVTAAGNLLSYTWTKGGVSPLAAPRITASGKSLTIKTASSATDAGVYQCMVSNPGGTPIPVTFTLNVIDNPPVVTNAMLPGGRVGQTYSPTPITFNSAATLTPTSFSATNLPAGLVCNASTGIITGKPTTATKGAVNVTLKATNAKGTGSVVLPITISDLLPNTVGTYTGLVGRDAILNFSLGGRISITVTGTGSYTGTLTLGVTGWPFKGVLETSSTTALGDTTFKVTGNALAHLTFTLDPAQARITTGLITTSTASLNFTAFRGMTPSNLRTGYHTFSLKLDPALAGNETYPQGLGYGGFTVPATAAAFSVAGSLADGTSFTSSSTLGPLGEVLVYQCIYSNKGSILGQISVTAGSLPAPSNTDSVLTGGLSWTRPHIAGRTYDPGFANIALAAEGGRINATKTGIMPMGFTDKADNASLAFTLAHVDTITPVPDLIFTLKKGGLLTVPGLPHRTSVAFAAATGIFSGTFTQASPARTGTYKGILVNHLGTVQGDGWFTLPQLLPTPTTSPIFSGIVTLKNKP